MAVALALPIALAGCKWETVGGPEAMSGGADLVERDIPPLTAAEVRAFLGDATLMHEGDQRIWHVYLREDGALLGHSEVKETGGVERARGSWEVRPDGRICRQWQGDWAGGRTGCAHVYRYGRDYVLVPEGAAREDGLRRTRLAGNPLSL
jgi:hypothetical protein